MKKFLLLFLGLGLFAVSCSDKDDEPSEIVTIELNSEVNDFVWKAMNYWYYWQPEQANLADDRFSTTDEFYSFLNGFSEPEDLYEAVQSSLDRFSFMYDNYDNLINALGGTLTTTGIEYTLRRLPSDSGNGVLGVVRYVWANSDAAAKGIKRGDIFYAVNGTELYADTDSEGYITNSNLDLLSASTFTLNFGSIENELFSPNDVTIEVNSLEITENPILIAKTLDVNSTKIGYIMYNGFTRDNEEIIDDAFSQIKSEGATELVIDLRYNPGGSTAVANRMAGRITGQFAGQPFIEYIYNSKRNGNFGSTDPFESTYNDIPLTSLGLTKVYIITTDNTASASELLINNLKPYITVVQVGETTVGKNEFSIPLVDNTQQTSDGYPPYAYYGATVSLDGINPNHKYALQPICGTYANADGFNDFADGLVPDIAIIETLDNLGELGDPEEPLLAKAIEDITGVTSKSLKKVVPESLKTEVIGSSLSLRKNNKMVLIRDFN
ncbi:S41 family peptidase [Cellulophaga sp. L1A9]|uniref:S41 family peptidase n=1 Tax=Cellulophaga sp. L1A9 TaxID=2686362 RepID=UPI00131E208E|nr:S41 family peptidase [Cellulophaga sp. L1A9]